MSSTEAGRFGRERERLDAAIDALLSSDGWRAWVTSRGRFHRYSLNNTLLIAAQAPGATRVAGFRTWIGLGRAVRKGERAIRIFAPMRLKPDPTDPAGEARVVFRSVAVFDVTQTDPIPDTPQAPLEPPSEPVSGESHAHLLPRLETLAGLLGYDVAYTLDLPAGVEGSCSHVERVVRVRGSLPGNGRVAVLVHELGHAWGVTGEVYSRAVAEVIVEAACHIVLATLGLDTTTQSVPYITDWAEGGDPREQITRVCGTIDELCRWFGQHLNRNAQATPPEAGGLDVVRDAA